MVTLTRLTGMPFALNPDLIERVDETPDTVITLVDGTKYLVRESMSEIVAAIIDHRARLIAAAGTFESSLGLDDHERAVVRRSRLSAVPKAPEPSAVHPPREG